MMPSHSHRISTKVTSRPPRWAQWVGLAVFLAIGILASVLIINMGDHGLRERYERIDYEMSRNDVEELLGNPTRVDTRKEHIEGVETQVDILEWITPDSLQVIRVELVGDKVISKMMDAS